MLNKQNYRQWELQANLIKKKYEALIRYIELNNYEMIGSLREIDVTSNQKKTMSKHIWLSYNFRLD
ncbi:MAG: hypothetical protein Q4C64_05835 [Erysipelotrichia bacterium]|nr:hypothetical protein [Erysipelotrichia bacterium]